MKNNFDKKKIKQLPATTDSIVTRKVEDIALIQSLLTPELFTHDFTDEHIQREKLIIQLRGGQEFTLEQYISENLVEYRSRFYKDYYYGIAKLYGIDKSLMDKYVKPQCVVEFTLQFIYARFPIKVLKTLQNRSPWTEIPGVRQNKLFQYLSTIASEQLDLFIDQAVEMMKSCDNIVEFKLRYSREYNVYFQLDMFTDVAICA